MFYVNDQVNIENKNCKLYTYLLVYKYISAYEDSPSHIYCMCIYMRIYVCTIAFMLTY